MEILAINKNQAKLLQDIEFDLHPPLSVHCWRVCLPIRFRVAAVKLFFILYVFQIWLVCMTLHKFIKNINLYYFLPQKFYIM